MGSQAEGIIRRSRENSRNAQREKEAQQRYNDTTNRANWYRMSMEEDTINRMADAENKRKLALVDREQVGKLDVQKVATSGDLKKQALVNSGQLDVQKIATAGDLERQALVNSGDMDTWDARLREGGRQFDASLGFDQKNKDRDFGLQREKDKFDQFAKLRGLDSQNDMLGGGDGAKPNLSQDWFKYRESSSGLTDKDIGVSIAHTLAIGGKLSEAQSDWVRANAGGVAASAAPIETSTVQTPPPKKKRKTPTYIPSNAMPRPFGNSFIRSNIGHTLGVDKAHNIATGFNRLATGAWDLSNKVGNTIIERGIKPAAKWATQEYDDPYRKK